MLWIKRLIAIAVLSVVMVYGVFFSVLNEVKVPLDLVFLQFTEQKLALWVLLAFALGGVVGLAVSSVAILRLRSRLLLKQRKLASSEKELGKLRTAALK